MTSSKTRNKRGRGSDNGTNILSYFMLFPVALCFCDLFYAYTFGSCQNQLNQVGLTLSEWLKVNGCGNLACAAIFYVSTFLKSNKYILFFRMYNIFNFAWLIIGTAILQSLANCSLDITIYMWFRLILGFVDMCAILVVAVTEWHSGNKQSN